jgi:hypothetical protein
MATTTVDEGNAIVGEIADFDTSWATSASRTSPPRP